MSGSERGSERDRRSVLRAAGASASLFASGLATTTAAAGATSASTAVIKVIPTTAYHQNYGYDSTQEWRTDWSSAGLEKARQIRDTVEEYWFDYIHGRDHGCPDCPIDLQLVENADPVQGAGSDRTVGEKVNGYEDEILGRSDLGSADGWVVLDYSDDVLYYPSEDCDGTTNSSISFGANMAEETGQAGTGDRITVAVEAGWEDEDNLPPSYRDVGTEGIAYHEVVNLFGGDDGDAYMWRNSYTNELKASILWDWNDPSCSQNPTGAESPSSCQCPLEPSTTCPDRTPVLSECNLESVQSHFAGHI